MLCVHFGVHGVVVVEGVKFENIQRRGNDGDQSGRGNYGKNMELDYHQTT